ncbi:glycosyltransferase family 2 protein [Hymenobacter sp. RP-2-7]|uniref:Glycosyltransferase family 2 protein n=1 Tax=Hymenobacter polaris TaxID=2682546 RepID=A0A7Y0AJ51_9BACT|nr:glycosyltransferase family 2 protein [Hymenobacter polaris]NML68060.1 glycosyltransferase family 2 protein [Hymenobacter polaris]
MYFVSVIIPNYNHAEYIEQRIESVLSQSYDNFEVIILDDYSTDNSREIINRYNGNVRVSHIIYNEKNSGSTFKQWEKGISLAKGEWIWIAESDDWCEPTLLETLIKSVNEKTTIAFCQSIVVHSSGDIWWQTSAKKFETVLNGIDFVQQSMLVNNVIINASMCIFRKQTYSLISKDYVEFRLCGDWLFWIEFAQKGEVYISGKVLNYFRKHDKDVSGKSYKNGVYYYEYLRLLNLLISYNIITRIQLEDLLIKKLKYLIHDARVEKEIAYKLKTEYFKGVGTAGIKIKNYKILGKIIYMQLLKFNLFK